MALSVMEVARYVQQIRIRNYARDQRISNVRAARSGDVTHIIPGMLPDIWPRPIVANTIDLAARFTAERIGIMPTLACSAGVEVSDLQKRYAQKRTLITHNYADQSKLNIQLVNAADWYDCYGFVPLIVEPHRGDAYCGPGPRLRYENPIGAYYDLDAYGRTKCYIKIHVEEAAVLAQRFPHLRSAILRDASDLTNGIQIELVQYMDSDQFIGYLPARNNTVVYQMSNRMGRVPVFIAERGKFDSQTRGSYDDVTWIYLARAKFAMLGMEAAEKSIQAPLAVPSDVQKVPWGPDGIIRTSNPQYVRRVALDTSPETYRIGEVLQDEAMTGARFPEGATGKSPGSVVTGRGMDALMGTIDTKVGVAQNIIGQSLQDALSFALEMDEAFWPRLKRQIRVDVKGNTYEESYTPARDIHGVWQVRVTYGMTAGMNPNNAIVFLLQARGDKLISRDFALNQLPFDINVDQEMEKIDVEELNDALKQGVFTLLGSVGVMAQQGQDPVEIIQKAAEAIRQREKGKSLSQALLDAFQPKNPPPGSVQPGAAPGQGEVPPGTPGAPSGPGAAPGGATAPPVAPGPAQGAGPGGQQSVMQLLAALGGGGQPNLSAGVRRTVPAG